MGLQGIAGVTLKISSGLPLHATRLPDPPKKEHVIKALNPKP